MRRDIKRRKQFTRRALALAGGKLLLASGLVANLYRLQVVEAPRYRILSDDNRIGVRLLPPERGPIVDRFGEGVAVNRQTYRLVLVPERAESVAETLERVGALVELSEHDVRRAIEETGRRADFAPVTVREDLSWREVASIEVNLPELPGVAIEASQSRFYPYGALAAHITGYVSAVSEAERTGDRLLELPGFRTGKSGVEKVFERTLRGSAGLQNVEVNAYGRTIREISRVEGTPGTELRLTVDVGLQAFAARRIRDRAGSVVAMDLLNGDVLALVSSPGFDPNAFYYGLDDGEWRALLDDSKTPLVNRAVSGQYSPGSIFKIVVALAALEEGLLEPGREFYCSGSYTLGDHVFHCWSRWGHGAVDMVEALKRSCDVYFYEVAKLLGIDRIAAMAVRLGFGTETGVELTGERAGLVPTRAWKEAFHGEAWRGGETLISGIGQGYLLATPLQLAMTIARVGNGVAKVTPRLTRPEGATEAPAFEPLGVAPEPLDVVRESLVRVVNDSEGGTAYKARIEDPGMEMAGKTATVQVRRITKAEREAGLDDEDVPWRWRDHAMFAAYAPLHAPRYACAVVIDHGGSGSAAAAPVARDVLREAQRRDSARWPAGGGFDPARDV